MIVVTGATGHLGGCIVRSLVARGHPVESVGASVRDPARASALQQLGVRVRPGDFDDERSLRQAFEGAAQVLLVSSNGRREGKDAVAQHAHAIRAAAAAGVRRIVYTSHMGASPTSKFPPMQDHAATEALLRTSGIAWTALRNGFYAASALDLLRDAFTSGEAVHPQDGKVCWTSHDDLANAAAAVLLDEGRFEGPTPALTASQAFDLGDLARQYSEVSGRTMARTVVSDADFLATLARRQVPEGATRVLLGLHLASRAGEFEQVDPALASILGREPQSMKDVMRAALAPVGG